MESIAYIHESLENGQIEQACELITKRGAATFFDEYPYYLENIYESRTQQYKHFKRAVSAYLRSIE
jgi:hypothetical protein